jgi:hypothetical protein
VAINDVVVAETLAAHVSDRMLSKTPMQAVVANRHVMREIPHLLRQSDVEITHVIGDVMLEIGTGEFFPGLAKNIGPIAVEAGIVHQAEFDRWIEAIDRVLSVNTFFGSCNYLTYGMVKAS